MLDSYTQEFTYRINDVQEGLDQVKRIDINNILSSTTDRVELLTRVRKLAHMILKDDVPISMRSNDLRQYPPPMQDIITKMMAMRDIKKRSSEMVTLFLNYLDEVAVTASTVQPIGQGTIQSPRSAQSVQPIQSVQPMQQVSLMQQSPRQQQPINLRRANSTLYRGNRNRYRRENDNSISVFSAMTRGSGRSKPTENQTLEIIRGRPT